MRRDATEQAGVKLAQSLGADVRAVDRGRERSRRSTVEAEASHDGIQLLTAEAAQRFRITPYGDLERAALDQRDSLGD
jgi:hypothetical protein